jgi:tRNA uridine 5-carbamoylmethylation protein Kti12
MITNFKNFKNKKEYILLVGPPGSGKSTYISKLQRFGKKYDIINRDDIVIDIAEKNGLTYKEMFSRPNNIFLKNGKHFIPNSSDFYVENGKKYLKNFEYLGDIIEVTDGEYKSRISPEIFTKLSELNNVVEDTLNKNIEHAIRKKHNIIIDMTNNNRYYRQFFINKLKTHKQYYKIIAVIFNDGGKGMEDVLINVNKRRDLELAKSGRNKAIPEDIIRKFISSYEPPTKSEGIDKIIHIDTKKKLEKII